MNVTFLKDTELLAVDPIEAEALLKDYGLDTGIQGAFDTLGANGILVVDINADVPDETQQALNLFTLALNVLGAATIAVANEQTKQRLTNALSYVNNTMLAYKLSVGL